MFNNWIKPDEAVLAQEYHVECVLKGLDLGLTEKEFIERINSSEIVEIDRDADERIEYRSHTKTAVQLLNLISGYASYPEFRNSTTLNALYEGFAKNRAMKMPIVLEFSNGRRRVLCGNTRMDVAFQSAVNPKVILLKVD